MKNFIHFCKDLDPQFKKISLYLFLTYFFVLLSYPLMRSATGAIFYEAYTSADYSFATFIGVIFLMFIIFINNKLQGKYPIHKVYCFTGILSVIALLLSFLLYKSGVKEAAYLLFAVKESYIVLLIHMSLAFGNAYYNLDQVKRLFGPLGAAGSIGGILGGSLTSYLAKGYGTQFVFYMALALTLVASIVFLGVGAVANNKSQKKQKPITPLKAIRGVRKYVLLICSVVILSQFVIFIGDLQFNIIFEKIVILKDERTAYLGNFYSYINILSLFIQFIVLPFALVRLKNRTIFFSVPLLYLGLITVGMGLGVGSLSVIAGVFIGLKGIDYSLSSVAKEVMYHPLLSLQKYGAKYITDMFIYRLAKAVIAFVMAKLAVDNLAVLGQMQFVFLALWIVAIIYLFKEDKRLKKG